jgi:hypothetical protein
MAPSLAEIAWYDLRMRDALIALICAPFWILLAPLAALIGGVIWLGALLVERPRNQVVD